MAYPPPPSAAAAPRPSAPPRTPSRQARIALASLLVVPAALAALATLVVPTVQTILQSFRRGGGVLGPARYVGTDNYDAVLGGGVFWEALLFSLSLAIIPLVVAVGVAPLLAGALDRAGTWPRRVGRVLLSVPLVVFSPVAISAAWQAGQRDDGFAAAFGSLTDPGEAALTARLTLAMATFGAVCGITLLAYLAVLRGRRTGRRVLPTGLAVGGIIALATFAVSLQAFAVLRVLTGGGPADSTQTLALLQFRTAFQRFAFGPGAVVATVTGLLLAVLGIAAVLIAILAALRIELTAPDRSAPSRPGGTLLGAVALLVVLAVTVSGLWPWASAFFASAGEPSRADVQTYLNTWVPPLVNALFAVGLAFLAALGIGGLRPLGRHSEWLLLPFAPWLFVGIGPLSLVAYENARDLELIGTSAALFPPLLLSVPALVILTLFCSGQSAHWQGQLEAGAPPAASFFRTVVVPALPLAVFLGGAVAVINAQDLLWPLLVGAKPDNWTAPVLLNAETGRFTASDVPVAITTPFAVVVLALIVLAALQIAYLDRLAITREGHLDIARELLDEKTWLGPR